MQGKGGKRGEKKSLLGSKGRRRGSEYPQHTKATWQDSKSGTARLGKMGGEKKTK